VSAVESLSDAVLTHLDKGHARADVQEAVGLVRAAGVALRPTWVPFTPWSTLDDYREMLDFVADEGSSTTSIPSSTRSGSWCLRARSCSRAGHAPFLGPLVERDFYYRWTHPDPRMDRLQEAVQAAVARAAESAEDPVVTFRPRAGACPADGGRATAARGGGSARPGPAAPAPAHRTVVLLSGAHEASWPFAGSRVQYQSERS